MNLSIWNTNAIPDSDFRTPLEPGQRWIKMGIDNLLPDRFIELNNLSPTHSGIINKKTDFTAGSDVIYTNPEFKKWGDNVDFGNGMHNLISKLAKDLHTHGGFCIQVIWYKNRRAVRDIIYQDFSEVRRGFRQDKQTEQGYHPQCVWISESWIEYLKFQPRPFDYFTSDISTDFEMEIPQEPVFLYYYRPMQGKKWYPLPDWYSAFKSVQNEVELINFMHSNIRQSFNPSGILQLPGSLTADEEVAFKKQVREEMTGTDNTGKIFTVFSNEDKLVNWTPLNSSPDDKKVNDYNGIIQQQIISAHKLPSPVIIGLPGGASIGGDGNTIVAATKVFYNQVILKAQNEILFQLNKLSKLAGFEDEIIIEQNIPSLEDEVK